MFLFKITFAELRKALSQLNKKKTSTFSVGI